MSLIATISQNVKDYPFTSGFIASITTLVVNIIGFLSRDETVKLIGSIGGVLGIFLTLLTIYYKIKNEQQKNKP